MSDTKHLDTQIDLANDKLTKYGSINPIMYQYWVDKIQALKEKRNEIYKDKK